MWDMVARSIITCMIGVGMNDRTMIKTTVWQTPRLWCITSHPYIMCVISAGVNKLHTF